MELSVFDFDDTLFISDSKVKVKKKSGKIKLLNSRQFAKYKIRKGDEFDFTDFDRINGSFVEWTKERFDASVENTQSKTVIMTARGKTDNLESFFCNLGYKLEDIIFVGTGSADPKSKIAEVSALVNEFHPQEIVYYENCNEVFEEFIYGESDFSATTSFYLLDVSKKNFNYKLFVKGGTGRWPE